MSFCAVTHLFQLSVCAQTIWHGSPARQCAVLSRGKIINHNLDGEGVRDWFDFSSRADSSTGSSSEKVSQQPLRAAGWTCEGTRPETQTRSRWQGGGRSRAPRRLILCSPSLLACPAAVVLQRASPCYGALSLALLGFRQLSLEQNSLPWASLHFAGFGHCRSSIKKKIFLVTVIF